ncbi:MAG: helix-turn-helix domain-containing protein [Firmicutes bacterium]|nr:helix-turn-helix domain-containing protein [Bacillota bacterium]
MNENIGEMIAIGRKQKRLTQAQLAGQLFVSPQAVGKWERGESLPDIFMLTKISEILGQTPNCLLTPVVCSCGACKWCCKSSECR